MWVNWNTSYKDNEVESACVGRVKSGLERIPEEGPQTFLYDR